MILVKLGGSVITDKSQYQMLHHDVLVRLCEEIYDSGEDVIIVHGAGSFGHIMAHDHRIAEGYKYESQIKALVTVSRDVRQLNLEVLDAMISAGISPVSLPPSACVVMRDREIVEIDFDRIRSYLKLGISPVMFGDVALDESQGFSICSGDQIMEALARELLPKRVIFVSDIDGIMDRDPSDPGAALIGCVRPSDLEHMKFHAHVKDVTGGIKKKLAAMIGMIGPDRTCMIINGNVPGRLKAALRGDEALGTKVELD